MRDAGCFYVSHRNIKCMYVISSPNSELSSVLSYCARPRETCTLCSSTSFSFSCACHPFKKFFSFPIEISCDMCPSHHGWYFLRKKEVRSHLATLTMQYFEHDSAKLGNFTKFYLEFLKITLNSNLCCTVSQKWTYIRNTGDSTDWVTVWQRQTKADLSSVRFQKECHKFSIKLFLYPQCFEMPDSPMAFFVHQVRGICETNLVSFCHCRMKL